MKEKCSLLLLLNVLAACLQAAAVSSLLVATVGVSPDNVAVTDAGTVKMAPMKRTVVRSL